MSPEDEKRLVQWIEKSMKKGHKPSYLDIIKYCKKNSFERPSKEMIKNIFYKYRSSAVRSRYRKPKIFAGSRPYFGTVQWDLAMFRPELKRQNKGYIGFLLAVEVLSGQIQISLIKSKKQSEFEKAFYKFVDYWDDSLHTLVSDEDSSISKNFQKRMQEETGVIFRQLRVGAKAAKSERMIGYVKEQLSLGLSSRIELYNKERKKNNKPLDRKKLFELQNWISDIDDIVLRYNRRTIKNTGVVRGSVNRGNYIELISKLYKTDRPYNVLSEISRNNFPEEFLDDIYSYNVGDKVLLNSSSYYREKDIFKKKSVEGEFLPRPFVINSRHLTLNKNQFLVPSYTLIDLKDNSLLKGFFYGPNLRPALFLPNESDSE